MKIYQIRRYAAMFVLGLFLAGCSGKVSEPLAENGGSPGLESSLEEGGEQGGEAAGRAAGEPGQEAAAAASGEGQKAVDGAASVKGKEAAPAASGQGQKYAKETASGQKQEKIPGTKTGGDKTAAPNETASQTQVVQEGMKPIYGKSIEDGVYSVKVDSSSSMFRITSCELTVKEGIMSAAMTMSGTGYLKLFMGTGEEALKAEEKDYIPYVETEKGIHTFEIPVEALDMGINCSAFSKNKETWYDRVLVFRADSLSADAWADGRITTAKSLKLSDGSYTAEVRLEGGSGKAFVESPASLKVKDGNVFATIIWSSSNYDYMKVNDEKFEQSNVNGNSTFEIPVTGFDWNMPVIADTIAMSQPHEVRYTLIFNSATLKKVE